MEVGGCSRKAERARGVSLELRSMNMASMPPIPRWIHISLWRAHGSTNNFSVSLPLDMQTQVWDGLVSRIPSMFRILGSRLGPLASYFAFSVHSLVGTNRNGLVLWELIAYRCEQARIGRRP